MESEGDDPKRKISQELISEIFARLPVKSLLRFRCVSKYWLAEISSPQFIKKHLSLAVNNKEDTHHMLSYVPDYETPLLSCTLRSMFCQNVTEAFDLDYPINDYKDEKFPMSDWILSSANGLICFAAGENDLFIGNPSIRKYRKLPSPRPGLMKSVQFPRYSFGYDEFHDDYKVVALFASYNISDQYEVEIYSLKGDSWRSVEHCLSRTLDDPGTCLNGKFHWIDDCCNGGDIYSFDLADEKWRKTVKQPFYRGGDFILYLTVLASDLSIFCNYLGTHDVWVMMEYGVKESWTMMFTIKWPGDEVMYHLDCPLFFMSKKGEILVVFGSMGMIYNPKDESIRYSEVINFDFDHQAEIYVESLVSPFLTEECEDATKNQKAETQIKIIEQQNPIRVLFFPQVLLNSVCYFNRTMSCICGGHL